jgi:hypothetical protein
MPIRSDLRASIPALVRLEQPRPILTWCAVFTGSGQRSIGIDPLERI